MNNSDSNHLALEKQLCFRLYRLNKALTKLYAPLLKELKLTYPQYLVMLTLWQSTKPSPPSLSVKALGKTLDLDSGTLSPLLKRMEQAGLITRSRSQEDERTVFISLTNEGHKLKQKAQHIPTQLFALTGLSLNDMSTLQRTLDTLLDNTKAHL